MKVIYGKIFFTGISGTRIWSKCPIGLLPFQSKVNCNLPEDHVWVVEKPQTKLKKKKLYDFVESDHHLSFSHQ